MCQNYAAFYQHRPSALLSTAQREFLLCGRFLFCVWRGDSGFDEQWLQICPAPSYKCINALLKKTAHSFAKAICAGLISNYCHTIQINLNSSKKHFATQGDSISSEGAASKCVQVLCEYESLSCFWQRIDSLTESSAF